MASRSTTTVFDYYTDVSESDGCVEGKCGSCSTIKLVERSIYFKLTKMLPKNLETLLPYSGNFCKVYILHFMQFDRICKSLYREFVV